MKRQATTIVEEQTKFVIQGYTLKNFKPQEKLVEQVIKVFGIRSYNDKIISIDFTRDTVTNVSYIKLATFY